MSDLIQDLFDDAVDEGNITGASLKVLATPDINTKLQAAMGIDVDDVMASEVVLVNVLMDDSVSMGPMKAHALAGQNEVVDSLLAAKEADGVLMLNTLLNRGVVGGYAPLDDGCKLDMNVYRVNGNTPLYDATLDVLRAMIAKTQSFVNSGVPVRTITLIVTDGGDNASSSTSADVRTVVEDLLRQEAHIIAGMGIDDGYTDFESVFLGMGIPGESAPGAGDGWILTPGNSSSEIRAAFRVFSQSAVRVSQSAATMSQVALGGFGS